MLAWAPVIPCKSCKHICLYGRLTTDAAFVKWFIAKLISVVYGDTFFPKMMAAARPTSVSEFWANSDKRNKFVKEWYDKVWHANDLDTIIAPVQAIPQLPHGYVYTFHCTLIIF
jgi:hypothetical protein